jgi:hypothetical protein
MNGSTCDMVLVASEGFQIARAVSSEINTLDSIPA